MMSQCMAQKLVSRRTFAGLDALGPCMIKVCVRSISAVLEPSATTSATAAFARFLANSALGAPVTTAHNE